MEGRRRGCNYFNIVVKEGFTWRRGEICREQQEEPIEKTRRNMPCVFKEQLEGGEGRKE